MVQKKCFFKVFFFLNNCCTGIVSIKLIFPPRRIHVMCKKKTKEEKKNGIKTEKKLGVFNVSKNVFC